MKTHRIKTNTDEMKVSQLVMGSAVKMRNLEKKELFSLYDQYLDRGGNCIDTARAYDDGRIEELVGDYIAYRGQRESVIISTKCCHPSSDGKPRLDYVDMKQDLEQSLKALKTDYVDILWLHKDDERCRVEKIVDDMNLLLKDGTVRMIGCSNWKVHRIEAANEYARKSNQAGFLASQIQWSIAYTEEKHFRQFGSVIMDENAYEWYLQKKLPVFAYSPQAQGFFSKLDEGGEDMLSKMLTTCYLNTKNREVYQRIKKFAQEHEVPVSVPVLAYLLNNRLTCFPVFGVTSKKMLDEALLATEICMTPEEADQLYMEM